MITRSYFVRNRKAFVMQILYMYWHFCLKEHQFRNRMIAASPFAREKLQAASSKSRDSFSGIQFSLSLKTDFSHPESRISPSALEKRALRITRLAQKIARNWH